PDRTDPSSHQVRSALANAAKVIKNRRRLARQESIDSLGIEPVGEDGGFDTVAVMDWLDKAPVSIDVRTILRGLADGSDADCLAGSGGVDLRRMRERISRARKLAAATYKATVAA